MPLSHQLENDDTLCLGHFGWDFEKTPGFYASGLNTKVLHIFEKEILFIKQPSFTLFSLLGTLAYIISFGRTAV